jgi:hypothetical protein
MKTSTGKTGTWISLANLTTGDELNDGSTVTTIERRTEKSAKLTVTLMDGTQDSYTYRGRNVLVVR